PSEVNSTPEPSAPGTWIDTTLGFTVAAMSAREERSITLTEVGALFAALVVVVVRLPSTSWTTTPPTTAPPAASRKPSSPAATTLPAPPPDRGGTTGTCSAGGVPSRECRWGYAGAAPAQLR